VKDDLLQYIETYGREHKIFYGKRRKVNITKTVETMIYDHRELTEKRLWERTTETQTNPSSIEESLKSRKFATLLDLKTKIVLCAKDFAKNRGRIQKVPLSFCDNCFQYNPDCPCKQDAPTQIVSELPTRYNGGDNAETSVKQIEKPTLEPNKISSTPLRMNWIQEYCFRQLSFSKATDDSYCHKTCKLVDGNRYRACMDVYERFLKGETIDYIAQSSTF